MVLREDEFDLFENKVSRLLALMLSDENVMAEVRRNSKLLELMDDVQGILDLDEEELQEDEDFYDYDDEDEDSSDDEVDDDY